MKLAKEEIFLGSILLPLVFCLGVLLSSVKSPAELFSFELKKTKVKKIHKVEVKEQVKEETPKVEALPSLSSTLAAPSASVGGDLKSLSAGLVSEGSGGSGGMNISQGESQTLQLAENTEGQNRPPRAIQVVDPVYPQSAQARGIEGFVVVEVLISESGEVTEAKVLSAQPEGLFNNSALEAIRKWKFSAGIENGKTVASRIKQKVNFELN